MSNFFKNFHNFYKEFGSYIPIFEKVSWEKVFFGKDCERFKEMWDSQVNEMVV